MPGEEKQQEYTWDINDKKLQQFTLFADCDSLALSAHPSFISS